MISIKNTFITVVHEEHEHLTTNRRFSHTPSPKTSYNSSGSRSPSAVIGRRMSACQKDLANDLVEFWNTFRLSEASPVPKKSNRTTTADISTCAGTPMSSMTCVVPSFGMGWGDAESVDGGDMLPSAGSALHQIGKCVPCAFLHKTRGCVEAYECQFCHLCDKSDYIMRRKLKAKIGKEMKRQKKAALTPEE